MRTLPARRLLLPSVPAVLAVLLPAIVLFSRRARSPRNDAILGLLIGILLGVCTMSLILRGRAAPSGTSHLR